MSADITLTLPNAKHFSTLTVTATCARAFTRKVGDAIRSYATKHGVSVYAVDYELHWRRSRT